MNWRTTTLGACCEIVSGGTPITSEPRYWGGEIQWATPKDLSELTGKYIDRTSRQLTEEGFSSCTTTLLPVNSVLLSSRAPIGHVAINTVPMATNQGFKSLVPDPDKLDSSFLYHWLRAHRSRLEELGNGATFKEISKQVVARVEISLPSIAEQRHIAAILDKADTIRRKRQDAVRLTEGLLHSTFLKIVGPSAKGAESWPVCTIESLASKSSNSMRTGPFGSDLLHSEFVNEGVAVLGIDNAVQNLFAWGERRFITWEKYERLRRYTVHPGDVIVTIMGTTGRSAVVPLDIPTAITTKHLATITVDRERAEPEFVSQALFRHPDVLHQIAASTRGAIMGGLNLGLIKALQVPVPPLDRQRAFTKAAEQIRGLAERMERERLEDRLFNSLVARAFSGQLNSKEG